MKKHQSDKKKKQIVLKLTWFYGLSGELSSLHHFKSEVETIKTDVECGVSFVDHTVQPQPGDTILCYQTKDIAQEIDWELEF